MDKLILQQEDLVEIVAKVVQVKLKQKLKLLRMDKLVQKQQEQLELLEEEVNQI